MGVSTALVSGLRSIADDHIVSPAAERMEKENSIGSDEVLPDGWNVYSILKIGILIAKTSVEWTDWLLNDPENVATTCLPGDVLAVDATVLGDSHAHDATIMITAARQLARNKFFNRGARLSYIDDEAAFHLSRAACRL